MGKQRVIRNPDILNQFEVEFRRSEQLSIEQKYHILHELYRLARQLGHFSPESTEDGLEVDLNVARILNGNIRQPSGSDR